MYRYDKENVHHSNFSGVVFFYMRSLRHLIETLLDLVFPRQCLGCGVDHTDLCLACLATLPASTTPVSTPLSLTITPFDYQTPLVKNIIRSLKYHGRHALAKRVSIILYDHLMDEIADRHIFDDTRQFVVVPIPISKKRQVTRGFNQSEAIARALIERDTTNSLKLHHNNLIKVRETRPQAQTPNREERLANLKDSMHLQKPHLLNGKDVILVDDVITTGATMAEAHRHLKEAGVRNTIFLAIAHS